MRGASRHRDSRGVATVLVLLAIASFVIAFILYTALGAISKRADANAANRQSFANLDAAIARFVMANKRLPCPAVGTLRTGVSDPAAASTTCNTPAGIVPWSTLGLSETDSLDSWGHYFSYRVYDGATGFTRGSGLDVANCIDDDVATVVALSGAGSTCNSDTHENTISDYFSGKGLAVNDLGTVKSGVAYALISHGETGYGADFPGASAPNTAPSSSSKEFLNAGSAGTYWIVAPSAPDIAGDAATHFDDVLAYTQATTLVRAAELPRAWPLGIIFDSSTVSTFFNNTFQTSKKITSTTTVKGVVTVSTSGDSARYICTTSTTPMGIAPCPITSFGGNDKLTTSSNEMLTLDFRVKRTKLLIKLADFEPGSHNEQARLTFYNGSTQVAQSDVTACTVIPGDIGQFRLTPVVEFTKVEIIALNKSGTGSTSDLAVSEVAACHTSTLASCALSTEASGYCP